MMHWSLKGAALCASLALLPVAHGLAEDDAKPASPCHKVTKQAPYRGLGYHHIVTIENVCDRAIACTVKSDSAPEPVELSVDAKSSQSVTLRTGSPAREFNAEVDCR